jgi:hypothetical protein
MEHEVGMRRALHPTGAIIRKEEAAEEESVLSVPVTVVVRET